MYARVVVLVALLVDDCVGLGVEHALVLSVPPDLTDCGAVVRFLLDEKKKNWFLRGVDGTLLLNSEQDIVIFAPVSVRVCGRTR
jgi:hypothetical protein